MVPVAGYFAWQWYTFNTFPKEARRPLRRAMMMHYYIHDPTGAVEEYTLAIAACRRAGLPDDSPEITGIMLRFAELHATHRNAFKEARELYLLVLHLLLHGMAPDKDEALRDTNRMQKIVGCAKAAGDASASLGDLDAARQAFEYAVRFMIGFRDPPPGPPVTDGMPDVGDQPSFIPDQVDPDQAGAGIATTIGPGGEKRAKLPDWVTPTDLGAALEALAGIYARQGRSELSLSVYLRTLEILQTDKSITGEAMACRTAIIQNNIADANIALATRRTPIDRPIVVRARKWAEQALASARKAGMETCAECTVVAECNLGSVALLLGDTKKAMDQFRACRDLAAELKFGDGVRAGRAGMQDVINAKTQIIS
ncbi:hypothetical protein HKX48_005861 [Thoreauomyces humboldtii]|nr:hypothetical protein HKX48_005861 [Thoreauomyces humboldtii]